MTPAFLSAWSSEMRWDEMGSKRIVVGWVFAAHTTTAF